MNKQDLEKIEVGLPFNKWALLMLRLIAGKAKQKSKLVFNWFVDFLKAFDYISLDVNWAVGLLKSYGVGDRLIGILQTIMTKIKICSRTKSRKGNRRLVPNYNRDKETRPNFSEHIHCLKLMHL